MPEFLLCCVLRCSHSRLFLAIRCCLLLLRLCLLFNRLRSSALSPFCRNLLTVEHFSAAILVFSARFAAAFCCFDFAFCSTTSVRPRSHLSLLGFVTFVYFTLRFHFFFIHRCNPFSSYTHALTPTIFHFSYPMKPPGETLSILLPLVLLSVVLEITLLYGSNYSVIIR